jgi:prepilin peptidase CpaA
MKAMPESALSRLLLLALVLAAAYYDVAFRRIPNRLTLGGLALGLGVAALEGGWAGLGGGLLGALAGFAGFFVLYLLRAMGAGDVKLMAAAGAFLGVPLVFSAALYSALAGGFVMIVVTLRARAMRRVVGNIHSLFLDWSRSGRIGKAEWLTLDSPGAVAVPYGVAIALGCAFVALFPRVSVF